MYSTKIQNEVENVIKKSSMELEHNTIFGCLKILLNVNSSPFIFTISYFVSLYLSKENVKIMILKITVKI